MDQKSSELVKLSDDYPYLGTGYTKTINLN